MAKKKKKKVVDQSERESAKPDQAVEIASFEDSLNELEQIVAELEAGNLSLADSLEKYEKGIRNLKSCHQILEHAENRIRILTGVNRDGTATSEDFDVQKTELHDRSEKRIDDRSPNLDDQTESGSGPDGENVIDDSRTLF